MTIGAQFATRNEVEVLRRKIERVISGAAIAQHVIDPGAVDFFTDLTDVPQDYAGAGNFLVRVVSTEDELEFAELMLADLADVYFPSGEPDIGDVLTYESGGWTSMPPGAGGALDDLSDVNAPAPNDQDVLTWDDGAGEWIAQAPPAGGAAYLDDLLDVYFPSGEPDIGDVLTYESGGWTSMALGVGTHDLLSAIHDDTLGSAVSVGSIVFGNATPKWAKLNAGAEGQILEMGATLPDWGRKITISDSPPSGGNDGDIWLEY